MIDQLAAIPAESDADSTPLVGTSTAMGIRHTQVTREATATGTATSEPGAARSALRKCPPPGCDESLT
ncbi:MAG: hypothetical protein ACM3ZE_16415 [Myxococcales bacterium]